MVINPCDLFEDITIYEEIGKDNKYILAFPALDIEETGHGLEEFAGEKVDSWNDLWGYGEEIITIEKIAQMSMHANPKMTEEELEDKPWMTEESLADILTIIATTSDGIDYTADYVFGLYRFTIDVERLKELKYSNTEVESMCCKVIDFISVIILMSIQIGGVITKQNIDPDCYYNNFSEEANPIMSVFATIFDKQLTPVYSNHNTNAEYNYLSINDTLDYILESSSSYIWLLAYFPLYIANFDYNIISKEDIENESTPKEKKKSKITVVDFVNFIIDQEDKYK